jgi:hypothetical protein
MSYPSMGDLEFIPGKVVRIYKMASVLLDNGKTVEVKASARYGYECNKGDKVKIEHNISCNKDYILLEVIR